MPWRAPRRARQARTCAVTRSALRPGFPLVKAKLHPPASRPGTISRPRIAQLLAADPATPVVAVIAPPGYGKTLVLAELATRAEGAVAWLALDDFDNDASVFLTYLAAAFDRIEPIEAATATSLAALGPRVLGSAVPHLAAELYRWRRRGTLVLDDVHRLVDPTCLDALTALIDHLPPSFRVVLAGRSEPGLPFGRFRAERNLLEIGRRELGLDPDETAALTAAIGHPLGRAEATALAERTEGWAVGIYLTTLAQERSRPPAGALDRTSQASDFLADYFWSELLSGLVDDDVTLLTRSSILDFVEPALADAVAGSTGAAGRLEALAGENRLLASTAGPEVAYRYHPLLRDYLRGELDRREPGAVPELHRRAASWYASAQQPELAIEHALAAEDTDMAAALLTANALRSYYGGHADRLDRWLRGLGDDVFAAHPLLAAVAAIVHGLNGRADAAEHLADIAEHGPGSSTDAAATAALESRRAMLRAIMARRGPVDARSNAAIAVGLERPGSPWRYFAHFALAGACLTLGDDAAADEALVDGIEAAIAANNSPFYGMALRAGLAIGKGDWSAGETLAAESHAAFDRTRLGDVVTGIHVHAVAARVAIHRGNLARGREELVHAQLARPQASRAMPWMSVAALLELARAYTAIADVAGARSTLFEAEQIVRQRPDLGVLATRVAEMRRSLERLPLALAGASTLTPAELRLLPILSTPLSFREIGERLFVSPHTVKTQARSIYAKFDASSRTEAVERAIDLGLLEPFPGLAPTRQPSRD